MSQMLVLHLEKLPYVVERIKYYTDILVRNRQDPQNLKGVSEFFPIQTGMLLILRRLKKILESNPGSMGTLTLQDASKEAKRVFGKRYKEDAFQRYFDTIDQGLKVFFPTDNIDGRKTKPYANVSSPQI